jgi:hypothetical protein
MGRGARPSKNFEIFFFTELNAMGAGRKTPACPCKIFTELNAIPSRKKEREMKLFGKRLAPFVKYMELRA